MDFITLNHLCISGCIQVIHNVLSLLWTAELKWLIFCLGYFAFMIMREMVFLSVLCLSLLPWSLSSQSEFRNISSVYFLKGFEEDWVDQDLEIWLYFPVELYEPSDARGNAGKYLTSRFWLEWEAEWQFLWCKFSHHDWFQANRVTSLKKDGVGKRCAQVVLSRLQHTTSLTHNFYFSPADTLRAKTVLMQKLEWESSKGNQKLDIDLMLNLLSPHASPSQPRALGKKTISSLPLSSYLLTARGRGWEWSNSSRIR